MIKKYSLIAICGIFIANFTNSQVIADYDVLIIQGGTTTHMDVTTELEALGHTVTSVPNASVTSGFDFSPYDVALFMWDTPMNFTGYDDLIVENESCNIGIVSMSQEKGMDSLFLGTGNFFSSGTFEVIENSHWITEPWAIGSLPLDFTYKVKISNIPSNVTTLGLAGMDTTLVVHNDFIRVSCPYYGHSSGMPWNSVGEELFDRIICWAASETCCDIDTAVVSTGVTLISQDDDASYQWIDCSDNSEITGQTGKTFTPSVDGSYAVVLTESGCSDTSACYTIAGVGLNQLEEAVELTIFPNPSKGLFNVKTEGFCVINIFDLSGKLILSQKINGQYTFDLHLENGTYLLQSISKTNSITKRIIIK